MSSVGQVAESIQEMWNLAEAALQTASTTQKNVEKVIRTYISQVGESTLRVVDEIVGKMAQEVTIAVATAVATSEQGTRDIVQELRTSCKKNFRNTRQCLTLIGAILNNVSMN